MRQAITRPPAPTRVRTYNPDPRDLTALAARIAWQDVCEMFAGGRKG